MKLNLKVIFLLVCSLLVCIMLLGTFGATAEATEEITIVWMQHASRGTWISQSVPPGWKIIRVTYFHPGLNQDSTMSNLVIDYGWTFNANRPQTGGFPVIQDNQGWTTIHMRHNFFTNGSTMEVHYVIRNMTAKETTVQNVAAQVWDSAEGKSAATLAKEARDRANQALTEINNVKNMVNNIQASVGPQINRVRGLNGATATTSSSFSVVVDASGATEFRARREGGTWTEWASVDNSLSVSGLTVGANTIQVEVRNASGATATGRMVAFRL